MVTSHCWFQELGQSLRKTLANEEALNQGSPGRNLLAQWNAAFVTSIYLVGLFLFFEAGDSVNESRERENRRERRGEEKREREREEMRRGGGGGRKK